MLIRKAASILIAIILISLFGLYAPTFSQQTDGRQKKDWNVTDQYGFPVEIAANLVVEAMAGNHRHIYFYVDAQHFSENNIRKLFANLAAEYKVPYELWLYAYSDRSAVQQAVDNRNGGILCVLFDNSPQGRRSSRNYGILSEPRRSGHYRAEYYRFHDGREQIAYSPDPEREYLKKIDLRNPQVVYTGDRQKDLMTAIEQEDVEKFKLLLEGDPDMNKPDSSGYTLLMRAASVGNAETVRLLLERKTETKLTDKYGSAALSVAARDGATEVIKLLLDKGAKVELLDQIAPDSLGDTTLMVAAMHGHRNTVKALLEGGAKLEARNRFGETALTQAAIAGAANVVQFLISRGADVNVRDEDGKTVLMLARNDRETVEALLMAGADFKVKDKEGVTALMAAAIRYEEAKAKALVQGGAGKESIEACKVWIANPPERKGYPAYRLKEMGYDALTKIYFLLGKKKEAVEAARQAMKELGERDHLRARLGFALIEAGDREGAMEQYNILKNKKDSGGWAESLQRALEPESRR